MKDDAMPETDWPALVATLLESRQTVLPKRLVAPGPDATQRAQILAAAACAPDHGRILPWRFIEVPESSRTALADVFAQALIERDASATQIQQDQAREKAYRAPWLMLAVVDGSKGDPEVDLFERIVSAGCAIQNMLLMATAQGFGSALTSGKALRSGALRTLFDLREGDHALCFVSIGTAQKSQAPRPRPATQEFLRTLNRSLHEP